MTVLTKDSRFEDAQGLSEVGGVTMCEVLDKIVKEGEIEAYLDMNLTVSEIAQKVNLSVPEVEKLLLHYQTNKISEDTLSCRTKPLYDA